MAGKGDKIPKTSDPKKYAEGWEMIFKRKKAGGKQEGRK